MDQTTLVCGGQASGNLPPYAQDLHRGQLSVTVQALLEVFAFQKGHGQIGNAAIFADLVDGNDAIVLDGRGRLGLVQEALAGGSAPRQRRQHHLERYLPLELGALGLEDHAHAAHTQDFQHAIRPQAAKFARSPRWRQESRQLRQRYRVTPRSVPGARLAAGLVFATQFSGRHVRVFRIVVIGHGSGP